MAKNLTNKIKKQTRTNYPFAEMRVDDFFFCDAEDDATRQTIRAAAHNHSKKYGIKLTSKFIDGKVKVVRVE